MTTSLALDTENWDLKLDGNGNLEVLSDKSAILQDVASAVQTWIGEVWYDLSLGLPFDGGIIGAENASLFRSTARQAALKVPGVKDAQVFPSNITKDRKLTGVIEVKFDDGEVQNVGF